MAGAATGYGSSAPSYGYYRPPQVSRVGTGNRSLALAAAGGGSTPNDPFGLLGTDTTNSAYVARRNATPPAAAPAKTAAPTPYDVAIPPNAGLAGTPGYTAPSAATSPVVPPAFDVNLTPEVQGAAALTGMNDQQAQAAALKQKQDLLLTYGDKNLISSILGDPTLAEAAAQNPTSTLAQLSQARGRNETALTEGLNKQNLGYSGYRVTQEQNAAQDYQNQLATAAANVGGALGSIDSNLTGALNQSRAQQVQALLAAYQNHKTDAGAGSGGAGTGAGGGPGDVLNTVTPQPSADQNTSGGLLGSGALSAPDLVSALALAASKRQKVAV